MAATPAAVAAIANNRPRPAEVYNHGPRPGHGHLSSASRVELLPGNFANLQRRRQAVFLPRVGRALSAIGTVLAASQNRLLMCKRWGELLWLLPICDCCGQILVRSVAGDMQARPACATWRARRDGGARLGVLPLQTESSSRSGDRIASTPATGCNRSGCRRAPWPPLVYQSCGGSLAVIVPIERWRQMPQPMPAAGLQFGRKLASRGGQARAAPSRCCLQVTAWRQRGGRRPGRLARPLSWHR